MTGPDRSPHPGGARSPLIHGPRGAFRWTAYALAVTAFAAAVPSPLYPDYERTFHFSTGVLGLVFGAYTPGVLLTLFLIAPQAERIGRKRLLDLGMALTALGAVTFALSPNVFALALARGISGLAVGATTSVATAAMSDLEPFRDEHHVARVAVAANFGGFAVGALLSGVLVEYAPDPTQLVYLLPIVASAVGLVAIHATPETAPNLGAVVRSRIQRITVPPGLRQPFWVAAGGLAACYSIYGLFAALVPSYVRTGLGIEAPVVAGGVIALMFGTAAFMQLGTSELRDRRALLLGFPLLLLALIGLVGILALPSLALLLIVTAGLGLGVGLTFMGSGTLVDRVAPENLRGEMLAGYYSAGYLAISVPTIGVAEATGRIGLANAGILFGAILSVTVAILYVLAYRTPTPPGGGGRVRGSSAIDGRPPQPTLGSGGT